MKRTNLIVFAAGAVAVAAIVFALTRGGVENTPQAVTTAFYAKWLNAAAKSEGGPVTQKLHRKLDSLVTEAFAEDIDRQASGSSGVVADPVICAGEVPQGFTVVPARVDPELSVMGVMLNYYGTERIVRVTLRNVEGDWKIDSVRCGP